MDKYQDLYCILQVHHQAEAEVIESAYKRLSKKYHPDINKGMYFEEKMKSLNLAYSILKDNEKRREYDVLWKDRHRVYDAEGLETQAANILKSYFLNIASRHWEDAYRLISAADTKRVCKDTFIEWQELVSSLNEIGEYECTFFKTYHHKVLLGVQYDKVFEFSVKITEKDLMTQTVQKTELIRYVVIENRQPKVLLGYRNIKEIVRKLRVFAGDNEYHGEGIHPEQIQRKLLLNVLCREIARSTRYRNPLSVIMLEVPEYRSISKNCGVEEAENIMKMIEDTIYDSVRSTDMSGRWGVNRFMVILTETRILGAKRVAEKLLEILKQSQLKECIEANSYSLCAGLTQYKMYSLQETIDLAVANLIQARQSGPWITII